jgi:chromosome segregation ATPase
MSFGFSTTELIDAVDSTIHFIIEIKQVPEQIRSLERDLQDSKDQLKGLESALEKCRNSLDSRAKASFDRLHKNLIEVLNDTLEFLKRFHPSDASKSSILSNFGRLRWVVDAKYLGNVKALRDRIGQIERSIDREIHLLNL